MQPHPLRTVEELAVAEETVGRDNADINKLDPSGAGLPDEWVMAAIKCLLTGRIKECVELGAATLRTYELLRADVMDHTMQKWDERNRAQ